VSDWRHHSACRDEDPELFFPEVKHGEPVARPKRICQRCPVSSDCLAWALSTRQEFGVWGGMSSGERRAALRRRAQVGARVGV
jgi:WhiB family redox-sensing transcriptional regulator